MEKDVLMLYVNGWSSHPIVYTKPSPDGASSLVKALASSNGVIGIDGERRAHASAHAAGELSS